VAEVKEKPSRSVPSLTGTLLENTRRCGPEDCWAYGFARISGKTYRIKVYEGGYDRGDASKKRWKLTFSPTVTPEKDDV
jgi:hypothetical protein